MRKIDLKKGLKALYQPPAKAAAIGKLRFETFAEGKCAQTLRVSPFSEEGPTIERVHELIRARGGPGRAAPRAFAERGVTMPSSVLRGFSAVRAAAASPARPS